MSARRLLLVAVVSVVLVLALAAATPTPRPQPRDSYTISGFVYDDLGGPAAGVSVECLLDCTAKPVTTDSEGWYAVVVSLQKHSKYDAVRGATLLLDGGEAWVPHTLAGITNGSTANVVLVRSGVKHTSAETRGIFSQYAALKLLLAQDTDSERSTSDSKRLERVKSFQARIGRIVLSNDKSLLLIDDDVRRLWHMEPRKAEPPTPGPGRHNATPKHHALWQVPDE